MSTYQAMTSYEQAKHDDLMRAHRERERNARREWMTSNAAALETLRLNNERMRARLADPVPPPILPYKD